MEITPDQKSELIRRAQAARRVSYAPYSDYPVGAALLTADGHVHTGANVENASYPLSICAERVAVFKAVTAGERDLVAIAVATHNGGSPCGACRQVLSEFGPRAAVFTVDEDGEIVIDSAVDQLLPHAFGPTHLP